MILLSGDGQGASVVWCFLPSVQIFFGFILRNRRFLLTLQYPKESTRFLLYRLAYFPYMRGFLLVYFCSSFGFLI